MKFGVREICDVVFKAKSDVKIGKTLFRKGQPVLYIDTATTSTLEGASTTVYAQGGRGNTRLIAWEGEKTLTFTVEDALLSPIGFSILSGAGLFKGSEKTTEVHVHATSPAYTSDGSIDLSDALGSSELICATAPIFVSITEADGKVTATKSTLPTVNDTAVDGEFVNKVSESNGKISVTRTAFVPSVTINAGTNSDAPSVNITINGKSATAQSITKATTGVFGVTKLTSDFSSTSTDLAVNGTAVNAALNTLTVTGVANIDASKTIKSWSETNGKVAIETQDIVISNANVATNAAIAISKIDGLQDALDADIEMSKITGLQEALNDKQPTIPDETYDAFGSAQAVIGNEDDTEDELTIYGLLAKIALLESRLEALENPSSDNTPEEGTN